MDIAPLSAQHDSLVCIDSDGCVFDTMEVKQKQCIQPRIVTHWGLEEIRSCVLETAEFVNLYSWWRGTNRFKALVHVFDFLRERPEVKDSGVKIPLLESLRKFIESGKPLGNSSLAAEAAETGDRELHFVLAWSEQVNRDIENTVTNVPPFPEAEEALKKISLSSDSACISQTPRETLLREWQKHGIEKSVSLIAGQENGTKGEQIYRISRDRYSAERIMVIGDSPGDLEAARNCKASFFPIEPSNERSCWRLFCDTVYTSFLNGQYRGAREAELTRRFQSLLPASPPWL